MIYIFQKSKLLYCSLFLFYGLLATAQPQKPVYLTDNRLLGSHTAVQIKARFTNKLLQNSVRNGVQARKIVYKTFNTDSTEILASGALLIPLNIQPLGIISYQHGTILEDSQAPSYYQSYSSTYQYATVLASWGFVVVCPDYIGYGKSKNLLHPYEHRQSLAMAAVNMLRACKEYCENNKIGGWDKVFLAGYSEGGYATMALQKMLEEKLPNEFNLIASSLGAGAYHKTRFVNYILNQQKSVNTSHNRLYVWVLRTYDKIYKINRPTNFYLKEPYASRVQANLFTADLNVKLGEAFTDNFRKGISEKMDKNFLNALKDNDIYDWKPRTPMRLFHGDADDLVPYFNSEDAYNAMKAQGTSQVELIRLQGKNHTTAVPDFILGTYIFFKNYIGK